MYTASAPGRLDVMGGIADYSGALVLQKAIRNQTTVSVVLRNDFQCCLESQLFNGETLRFTIDYRSLLNHGRVDYRYAHQQLQTDSTGGWAAYVLGCVLALQKEKGVTFTGGDFIIRTEVPHGKGVASSAALEVATLKALEKAFGLNLKGTELPRLAQIAENHVAGAPCGLMDQIASTFGNPNSLLPIICQPDHVKQPVPIPNGLAFSGIDSGLRHHVSGASYADVRCAAFMGYTIVALSVGARKQDIEYARIAGRQNHLPFSGYLCNISVRDFENRFAQLLPETIKGADFLKEFGPTHDSITSIKPDRTYKVKTCASHPVYEQHRASEFLNLIRHISATSDIQLKNDYVLQMGALMLESHNSYSACGLGSHRTDEIVNQALKLRGIKGARVTGGGNGGTVCLMLWGEEGLHSARELHGSLSASFGEVLEYFD